MTDPVAVIGLGPVGAVAAACLARRGHRVVAIDRDEVRVAAVEAGRAPVDEPGLAELMAAGRRCGRLRATTRLEDAIPPAAATLVCVGTPVDAQGHVDLHDLEHAIRALGQALRGVRERHVVIVRSTVPPGTTARVAQSLAACSGLRPRRDFGVCAHPEFLREGSAIADFEAPDAVVIGALDARDADVALALGGARPTTTITRCDPAQAELLKYLHNAWNALRVSFANEADALAAALAVDGAAVLAAFAGNATGAVSGRYLAPGGPWGGACLGKDLASLRAIAGKGAVAVPLLDAVARSNEAHLERCVTRILASGARRIGLVGLAFKPGIGDVRGSPYLTVAGRLAERGADVRVFDPRVTDADLDASWRARRCDSLGELADACDLLVLCHRDDATREAVARCAGQVACVELGAHARIAHDAEPRLDDVPAL